MSRPSVRTLGTVAVVAGVHGVVLALGAWLGGPPPAAPAALASPPRVVVLAAAPAPGQAVPAAAAAGTPATRTPAASTLAAAAPVPDLLPDPTPEPASTPASDEPSSAPPPMAPTSSPASAAADRPPEAPESPGAQAGTPDQPPVLPRGEILARVRYPALALQRRIEALVVVEVPVAADGTLGEVRAVTDPGWGFVAAVRGALAGVRAAPALVGGRPTAALYRLPLRFTLTGVR